ncbi:hypothetical protein GCM10027034_12940 [Ramlibacter solisilvae]|uniref:GtrA/DPMS transmembrane domain-containing protein n=1 Tax=Ramlibacter tataouinensis TaxID=94132 RepID=A0A127JWR7_9BURK|nr:hypothetical protein UC35_18360 [Ramlibacter tataouinensis]
MRIIRFLKFTGISGAGWLLDFALLLLLVGAFDIPIASSNLISSCMAAVAVFLISRQTIFQSAPGAMLRRVGLYFTYSLSVVLLASVAIRYVAQYLPMLCGDLGVVTPSAAVIAATAKLIMTPPQLFMNFLAARLTSESKFRIAGEPT